MARGASALCAVMMFVFLLLYANVIVIFSTVAITKFNLLLLPSATFLEVGEEPLGTRMFYCLPTNPFYRLQDCDSGGFCYNFTNVFPMSRFHHLHITLSHSVSSPSCLSYTEPCGNTNKILNGSRRHL